MLDTTCQQESGIVAEWDRLISIGEQRVVADSPEVVIGWAETSAEIRVAVADVLATVPDPGVDTLWSSEPNTIWGQNRPPGGRFWPQMGGWASGRCSLRPPRPVSAST